MAWVKASSEVSMHMAVSLTALSNFYDLCAGQGFYMTDKAAQEAEQSIKKCLKHDAWLQSHFKDGNRFQVTPKFSNALHLAAMCHFQAQGHSGLTSKKASWGPWPSQPIHVPGRTDLQAPLLISGCLHNIPSQLNN